MDMRSPLRAHLIQMEPQSRPPPLHPGRELHATPLPDPPSILGIHIIVILQVVDEAGTLLRDPFADGPQLRAEQRVGFAEGDEEIVHGRVAEDVLRVRDPLAEEILDHVHRALRRVDGGVDVVVDGVAEVDPELLRAGDPPFFALE
ncbi:MAG: hypothetical protein Q9211_006555 [Gyalolechia sp. 1 TL-2023]